MVHQDLGSLDNVSLFHWKTGRYKWAAVGWGGFLFFGFFLNKLENVYLETFFAKFFIKHREYLTPNCQKFAYVY